MLLGYSGVLPFDSSWKVCYVMQMKSKRILARS